MQYLSNLVVCRPQLYIHGEAVAVNICIRNHSNKVVKKIKASILQTVDVVLFQNGQYRNVVTGVETQWVTAPEPTKSKNAIWRLVALNWVT